LLALRASPPSISHAEGERIAREVYGLAVSSSALPGERDCNFRLKTADGREFVLKIIDARVDAQSADCLARVLEFLAETDPGLAVPRLIPTQHGEAIGRFVRDDIDCATCLMSFLPGQLLIESTPNAGLLQNLGNTLARLDRALQGFFHPSLGRRLAWDVRRLPALIEYSPYIEFVSTRAAVQQVANSLRERLTTLHRLRSQAIHGDCHAHNLLVDVGGRSICGILDFGDMIHAPVILELGISLSELLTDGVIAPAELADVLHAFAQGQQIGAAEIDLLFDIVTARHAATILLYGWRSRHDSVGAALLQVAAARAGESLEQLLHADRNALAREWHAAAGTDSAASRASRPQSAPARITDLGRRHRLLGSGAELFYDQPLHIVRGDGVWLYESQGRAYLDVYNNVPHVGHSHPTVVAAIQRQSAILATHTRYLHEGILQYAEELTARLPRHLDACIFVNSGSEANDVAWRIAKLATGAAGALVMAHAYHGITDAVAALTPGIGLPSDPWVQTLAAPDAHCYADKIDAAGDADRAIQSLAVRGFAPAAFFIDSALTSTGIYDPPPAWAKAIASRVHAAGGLVVADEVQYGLGRSGSHFWGFERRGLSPDIVTLGKPVGNGYPMGVVIASHRLIEAFQVKFGFFSTFGGNAVAAAAGIAVLEVLEQEALQENAQITGAYLREQLIQLAARHRCLGPARGNGLLQGLPILGSEAAAKLMARRIVNTAASEFGVLIGSEGPHGNVLKLRPPMPFRREHVDMLIRALDILSARED
jgi:4-aminobutyrate aminotransferase-like enzyme/Ser/Thr protein kinase RdoA (MazF antagonist)